MTPLFSALTGWLLFASLVIALGSFAARWVIVPRAVALSGEGRGLGLEASRVGEIGTRTAERMTTIGVGLLPLAMTLVFARQLIEFRDPFATWSEDAQLLLSGTEWGATWTRAGLGVLVALLATLAARAGLAAAWVGSFLCVAAVAAFPGFTGHAAGTDGLRPLTLTADWLHVVAAGGWVGGLGFVLFTELRYRKDGRAGSVLPAMVPAFSPVAIVCVMVLAVTGTFTGWVHVDGFDALLSTEYGRTLIRKLAFVAGMLALGAVNWKRLTPRLGDADGPSALRRSATLELVLAQVVLILTALLVRTSPMGH